jgi:hypothetical protein
VQPYILPTGSLFRDEGRPGLPSASVVPAQGARLWAAGSDSDRRAWSTIRPQPRVAAVTSGSHLDAYQDAGRLDQGILCALPAARAALRGITQAPRALG